MTFLRLFSAQVVLRAIAVPLLCCAASIAPTPALAFDLQGHRGARGHHPENTLPAFAKALALGVTTLETDTVITRDGVVALGHDPRLNPDLVRTSKGDWVPDKSTIVQRLTWAELQTYDVGRIKPGTPYAQTFSSQVPQDGLRMPRLSDLFDMVKALKADHVRFDIETKMSPLDPDATLPPADFVKTLLSVIQEHGMARRTQIQSFDWRPLREIKRLQPEIETVCLTTVSASTGRGNVHDARWTDGLNLADHGHSVPALVKAAACDVWSPNFNTLTGEAREEARRLGLRVIPWTVNTPADLDRMLDLKPDGLITDYPDRAREAMARRGMALPPSVVPLAQR